MKNINFFLIFALFFCSCEKKEEDPLDLDQMVQTEEELEINSQITGDPLTSPEEFLPSAISEI